MVDVPGFLIQHDICVMVEVFLIQHHIWVMVDVFQGS